MTGRAQGRTWKSNGIREGQGLTLAGLGKLRQTAEAFESKGLGKGRVSAYEDARPRAEGTLMLDPWSPQASRLIVTFDEHVISNNFKFGVIYQKLGQVCLPFPSPGPALQPTPPHLTCHLPGHSVSQEPGLFTATLWEEVGQREPPPQAAAM